MSERRYAAGTLTALASLANGTCYWPGCPEPVAVFIDEKPVHNLHMAHIRGFKPTSARYDPEMTDEERNSFPNLTLLCKPHHYIVDTEADKYPVELLHEWKSGREGDGQAALKGLRNVTEERLQELITEAIESRDAYVNEALNRFAEVDSEAASVLRGLIEELNELHRRPVLDPDTVDLFFQATRGFHFNEDTVGTFMEASRNLRLNEHIVDGLHSAAAKLSGLSNTVEALNEATAEMRRLQTNM
jgi:hypothetical protein